MKKAVTTFMVLSLTGNVFPLINILAISSLVPLYVLGRNTQELNCSRYSPQTAQRFLRAAYVYWTFSYLLTGASFSNFFSFDFLRFDGALLIAYLPLLLVTDVRLEPTFIRRTVGLFLSAMSLVALFGLAEFLDSTLTPLGLSRLPESLQLIHNASLATDIFHGFFRAHNAAGAIYAMASLISFSLLALGKSPSLVSWPAFWLGTNFVGLVLTQSRTAYVAFLAALLLVFFRRRESLGNSLRYGCFILVPLLYLLLVQPVLNRRTEAVSNLEDPNIVLRFLYYQRAFDDFVQSPIIGTGFGRFNDDLKTYSGIPRVAYIATAGVSVNDDLHAHNSYLHFLAEGGIIGCALMISIWIATLLWIGNKKAIFSEGSFARCFAEAIQACIVLEFFMSFTEHMMGTAISSLAVFTLTGLFLNLVGWKYRLASLISPEQPCGGEWLPWPAQ